MTPPNVAPLTGCPQCRTALQINRGEDGRLYRRCPRCGWNDFDLQGPGAEGPGFEKPDPNAPPPYIPPSPPRKSGRSCTVAIVMVLLIFGIITALYLLSLGSQK